MPGLALGPRRRRHQDPDLPPHPRAAARCVEALREQRDRQAAAQRRAQAPDGTTTISSSPPKPAPHSTPPTSGAGSAASPPRRPRRRRTGHRASCGTASCRCCPTRACPIEQIARLVGHAGGSAVTETVYRKQLRPVIDEGATAMNRVFPTPAELVTQLVTHASRRQAERPGPGASLEAPDQAVCWWAIQGLNL